MMHSTTSSACPAVGPGPPAPRGASCCLQRMSAATAPTSAPSSHHCGSLRRQVRAPFGRRCLPFAVRILDTLPAGICCSECLRPIPEGLATCALHQFLAASRARVSTGTLWPMQSRAPTPPLRVATLRARDRQPASRRGSGTRCWEHSRWRPDSRSCSLWPFQSQSGCRTPSQPRSASWTLQGRKAAAVRCGS